MQQLESLTYEAKPIQIQRQVVYGVGDLESLSATTLYYGSKGSPLGSLGSFGIVKTPLMKSAGIDSISLARNTKYFQLSSTPNQIIGVTHHSKGLGKLKVYDSETDTEYGIPIIDILNKPLKNWNIDRK